METAEIKHNGYIIEIRKDAMGVTLIIDAIHFDITGDKRVPGSGGKKYSEFKSDEEVFESAKKYIDSL